MAPGDLVAGLGDGDAERAAGPSGRARAEAVVLHRLVRGQHVRPGPAVIAARRQAVPVGLRAPHPHHPVHRRRPAEHPAPQPDLVPAVGRDRARLVAVEVPVAAQGVVEPLRDVQQRVDGAAAVLDEQHARPRPGRRQPPRQHAPGRPRAHDDVVELHTAYLGRSGQPMRAAPPSRTRCFRGAAARAPPDNLTKTDESPVCRTPAGPQHSKREDLSDPHDSARFSQLSPVCGDPGDRHPRPGRLHRLLHISSWNRPADRRDDPPGALSPPPRRKPRPSG